MHLHIPSCISYKYLLKLDFYSHFRADGIEAKGEKLTSFRPQLAPEARVTCKYKHSKLNVIPLPGLPPLEYFYTH